MRAALLALALLATPAAAQDATAIIDASIARYDGVCACPYSIKANGKACGKASAYSRPGGQLVLCFEDDIQDLAACDRAITEPTDANLQACHGEPVELLP